MDAPEVSTRSRLVQKLLDPTSNVEFCAFLLATYAAQWKGSHPDWAIDDQPEILATLYQIGFQHSYPKPDPRPNEFGLMVAEEMKSPWIVENF